MARIALLLPFIIFANRVYQLQGPSQVQWMGITSPDTRVAPITEAERAACMANAPIVAAQLKARVEAAMGKGPKLLSWSDDQTMYAYADRDPSIPAPNPNPWGCTDCFYSVLRIARSSDLQVLTSIPLPSFGEHWNYPTSIAWSPDGKSLLVGAEAGSSTAHYEDYWLLNLAAKRWQYIGGGNGAKWSPDSSQIAWSTARDLEPLGKIHVWVVHLMLVDARTFKQTPLTSGTSYVSEFHWCTN